MKGEEDALWRAGRLVLMTEGEYSDFGNLGCFVVLQDVGKDEVREVAQDLLNEVAKEEEEKGYSEIGWDMRKAFLGRLIAKGWLLDVDVEEFWLGAYGNLDGVVAGTVVRSDVPPEGLSEKGDGR